MQNRLTKNLNQFGLDTFANPIRQGNGCGGILTLQCVHNCGMVTDHCSGRIVRQYAKAAIRNCSGCHFEERFLRREISGMPMRRFLASLEMTVG